MGLFDYVTCADPRFVCPEGHSLVEYQTKDLGRTMGHAEIGADGMLSTYPAKWGRPVKMPLSGTLEIYGDCLECPAFVQAGTMNLIAMWVEFVVQVSDSKIVSVRRTSPTLAEWLAREPAKPYMEGCFGPMPYADAWVLHINGRLPLGLPRSGA